MYLIDHLQCISLNEKNTRSDLIEWIYAQQIIPNAHNDVTRCGFRGSPASSVS